MTPAYSPEAAAVLLSDAGWIDYDGDGVREDVNGSQLRPVAIVREDSRPELAAVMARVARDLEEVGIALSVEVLPPDVFDDRWITRRDYDLIAYAYDQLPGFTDFDLYGSAWDIRIPAAGIRVDMRTPKRMKRSMSFSAPSRSSVRRPPCAGCKTSSIRTSLGSGSGFPTIWCSSLPKLRDLRRTWPGRRLAPGTCGAPLQS